MFKVHEQPVSIRELSNSVFDRISMLTLMIAVFSTCLFYFISDYSLLAKVDYSKLATLSSKESLKIIKNNINIICIMGVSLFFMYFLIKGMMIKLSVEGLQQDFDDSYLLPANNKEINEVKEWSKSFHEVDKYFINATQYRELFKIEYLMFKQHINDKLNNKKL